jgi:TorA maturation chaperone TorD
MMSSGEMHAGLSLISRLFSYPGDWEALQPEREGLRADAPMLPAERNNIDPVRLENEYVRLFINAMPEVPCAPYGSVYLEGSVMGESTLKVMDIYRKYGVVVEELADHIAVESEFLAWLSGPAAEDERAQEDFDSLLGHLRGWTALFFDQVEQHDQLGWYRRSAGIARRILAEI